MASLRDVKLLLCILSQYYAPMKHTSYKKINPLQKYLKLKKSRDLSALSQVEFLAGAKKTAFQNFRCNSEKKSNDAILVFLHQPRAARYIKHTV